MAIEHTVEARNGRRLAAGHAGARPHAPARAAKRALDTTLDYCELPRHHREAGNTLTIATHDRHIKIDYGMLHLDASGQVQLFEEKPEIVSPVSMGIYVMEPDVLAYLPAEGRFDFPDLVQALLAAGEPVGAFRHTGLWFDIGRPTDYEAAVAAWHGATA